jgi:orotate phosphoribosyltransferase-like protein
LSHLAELEGTSNRELATELNCDPATVQWLFLCRSPSSERFAQDVERIASHFSLDAKRLAGLVRRADAVMALAASGHNASEGILLAARDREEDKDKP